MSGGAVRSGGELSSTLASSKVGSKVWREAMNMAEFDLAIRGGRVVDGTGNPWFYADVGVKDGRISRVGSVEARDEPQGR